MLQRFDIRDDGVTHIGQYVHTAKYAADSSRGRLSTSGFGTRIPGSDVLAGPIDDANSANISVIPWAGDLLALWEPGSAYVVDSKTLATRGTKTWSEALRGKPFSAHPRIGSDGTLWNFGVDPVSSELVIYRISSDGRLLASHVLPIDHLPPTHDFAVTERHLVFLMPSLTLNKERLSGGVSFAEACQWSPEFGMRVLILDKADWSPHWLELPPGCLFHIANAWEGSDGAVIVDYMRSDDPMSLLAGWSVMAGEYRHQKGARLTSASLNPRTGACYANYDRRIRFGISCRAGGRRGKDPIAPSCTLNEAMIAAPINQDSTLWRFVTSEPIRPSASTMGRIGWSRSIFSRRRWVL
jgi:carotenoid cleavage dioxygenase